LKRSANDSIWLALRCTCVASSNYGGIENRVQLVATAWVNDASLSFPAVAICESEWSCMPGHSCLYGSPAQVRCDSPQQ
jgi:hypothetical protein